MGYGDHENETAVLELTYNYGAAKYIKGNAYSQVCLIYSIFVCVYVYVCVFFFPPKQLMFITMKLARLLLALRMCTKVSKL